MTRLGASPPPVCHCGHPPAEHYEQRGRCEADVERPELGRAFGCFCPQFDVEADQ
jgi:hypothetical protein